MIRKWWRFTFWFMRIVDDDNWNKRAYPLWYIELPRFYKTKRDIGLYTGILLSRSVSVYYRRKK